MGSGKGENGEEINLGSQNYTLKFILKMNNLRLAVLEEVLI